MKIWSDPIIESLPAIARYVFLYLVTSPIRNESALYDVTFKRIANDTGLRLTQVKVAIDKLIDQKRVMYDPSSSTVWVINAVKHQTLNENCMKSILTDLDKCSSPVLAHEFACFYDGFKGLETHPERFPTITQPTNRYREQGLGTREQGLGIRDSKEQKVENKKDEVEILPSCVSLEIWDEFRAHRREIKSPMTPRSERMLLSKVEKLAEGKSDVVRELIEQAIAMGWKGIFPLKNRNDGTHQGYYAKGSRRPISREEIDSAAKEAERRYEQRHS